MQILENLSEKPTCVNSQKLKTTINSLNSSYGNLNFFSHDQGRVIYSVQCKYVKLVYFPACK